MDPFGRRKRNLTEELIEGATDGALKKGAPDRSNRIENPTDAARGQLSHVWGGFDWSPGSADQRTYTQGYVRGA